MINLKFLLSYTTNFDEIIPSSFFFVYNLVFCNNAVLSCFSLYFLITDSYLLIPAFIANIFIPTAKLVTPVRIPTEKAKVEVETHPVFSDVKLVSGKYN